MDNNEQKYGFETRLKRFKNKKNDDTRGMTKRIHRVGDDEFDDEFDPNDIVKTFNAGEDIE